MITLTKVEPKDLVDLIATIAQGNLSDEACYELAYFLDDVFSEGLEIDRFRLIVESATEYDSQDELIRRYLTKEEQEELKEEAREDGDEDDWTDLAIEKIQEDYDCTAIHVGRGFLVIE